MSEFKDVIVIGAGLTGLAAGQELAKSPLSYVILEKESEVGGRARSEIFEDCILDRGFQVVLPAYPSVKALNLPIRFMPFSQAATCISLQGTSVVADPIHDFSLFRKHFFRSKSSVEDLLRLLKHMRSRRFDLSTDRLIDQLGYSKRMQKDFLRPFLSGVLLDPSLHGPSPLSSYCLERFFLGGASLVEGGIQEFPLALAKGLNIELNSEVSKSEAGEVITTGGKTCSAKLIIDTRPFGGSGSGMWLSTQCHYFCVSKSVPLDRRIVLCSMDLPTSINHIANLSEISPSYSPSGTALLSVTTRGNRAADKSTVQCELIELLDLKDSQVTFLKSFTIEKALPSVVNLSNSFPEPPTPFLNGQVISASDTLAYGSQHAALRMGEMAGEAAIAAIQKGAL